MHKFLKSPEFFLYLVLFWVQVAILASIIYAGKGAPFNVGVFTVKALLAVTIGLTLHVFWKKGAANTSSVMSLKQGKPGQGTTTGC